MKDLNRHRQAANPPTSGLTAEIFAILFPGSPAVNALLATLYISGPPSMFFHPDEAVQLEKGTDFLVKISSLRYARPTSTRLRCR